MVRIDAMPICMLRSAVSAGVAAVGVLSVVDPVGLPYSMSLSHETDRD